ncbi:MAG: NAD(P)-dependent oxidoreductase [Cypionkella sp.]
MALSALPLFHRVAGERVVVLGGGPAAGAKRRLVERAGAACCGEEEAHYARLAFVALDDARQAEAAALRLRRRGLLVNVVDRPELCDFTVPSLLERDPVLVAVGTAGASAGLAKQLRLRLEAIVPPSVGPLARAIQSAREALRARWPQADDRRRALDRALTAGGALDPLDEGSPGRVAQWLESADEVEPAEARTIVLASADPDDLTLREARWLGEADTVLHDAEVPAAVLDRARADAMRGPLEMAPRGRTVIVRWTARG